MQETENALARLREIAERRPDAKSLLLTLRMDVGVRSTQAFEAGAHAVVSKTVHPVVARHAAARDLARQRRAPLRAARRGRSTQADCPLTDRELEILRLVAEGHTNGRIARELWVTEQTVKFHLSNTYRKLGVANRTEASRYAHMHNLTAPQEQLAS